MANRIMNLKIELLIICIKNLSIIKKLNLPHLGDADYSSNML